VFHGAKDPTVPVERSREMVAAIKAAGGNVKYTEYPEDKHDCWTETYNNPELYQWLLAQKR
jgi:predicted peptidase